jgi:hypothetical protein
MKRLYDISCLRVPLAPPMVLKKPVSKILKLKKLIFLSITFQVVSEQPIP